MLKEKESEIKLAKVDGTVEEELVKKMHVTGYPTLYFYREGEYIKYSGTDWLLCLMKRVLSSIVSL